MSLFLRAWYEYTLDDVPRLSDEDAKMSVPERSKDQILLDDVKKVFDFVPDEESDDESAGKRSVQWVLPDPVLPEPTRHEGGGAAAGTGGGASSREDGGATARDGQGAPDASGPTEPHL